MQIHEIISDVEVLLQLEPEEVGGVILKYLCTLPENAGNLNRHNFSLPHTVEGYPKEKWKEASKVLMEGWMWLEREGMVAPMPGNTDWYFVTRRGKLLKDVEGTKQYARASEFPSRFIHPVIEQKIRPNFLRGEYDTAVFLAFKEVEISVRKAGGFSAGDFGTDLMRDAFNPKGGPLTNPAALKSEQQALSDLFAGAIGSYKNPHSHRNVTIQDSIEALEMIMLASHLMKIVDAKANPNP